MPKCIECGSKRVISIEAECGDRFKAFVGKYELEGQVPDDLNLGSGDLLEFSYCGECGQIQADFPLDSTTLELDGDEAEED